MTPKQKSFINVIATKLDLSFDKNMSAQQASIWISDHIAEFETTQEQERLEDECNSYGLPNQD